MLSSAMPSAKPGLRPFVTACLERAGAVLEEAGFELVEALLPEELYHLQDQDHLLLAFGYEVARENPEAIFLTYGSPPFRQPGQTGRQLQPLRGSLRSGGWF